MLKQSLKKARYLLLFFLTIFLLCFSLPRTASAAAGDLDPTFGNGGKVITDFNGGSGRASALVIQPDGKIIAAGGASDGVNAGFALTRYHSNGNLDMSFGIGGKVITAFNLGTGITDIALQSDGKIVAVGTTFNFSTQTDFALARYNSDGSLDMTFGSGGKVVTDLFNQHNYISSVLLQPDSKIVVVGGGKLPNSQYEDFVIVRYNADGSFDNDFGIGGKVFTDFFGGYDVAQAVILQPDGKILATGNAFTYTYASDNFGLARYNTDGSLDVSFGSGGKVLTTFPRNDNATFGRKDAVAYDISLEPNGKIIAAGSAGERWLDFALARYNSDGSLDSSFGSAGLVITDFSGYNEEIRAVKVQQDGKIIAAGFALNLSLTDVDFALARYNQNGTLDGNFGNGGKRTTDMGANDEIFDMAIHQDNKVVVAGVRTTTPLQADFVLARYNLEDFNLCLQDESNGNILQINSTTGDYQFTNCSGVIFGGTGTLTRRGSAITLQHNTSDRRVMVSIDTNSNRATASLQMFSQGVAFRLTDRNILNNTCACR